VSLSHVIPAFSGGGVLRNAHKRRASTPQQMIADGAQVLALWEGQIPINEAAQIWLSPQLFEPPHSDDLVYLGAVEGAGDIVAQELGPQGSPPALPTGFEWGELRQAMAALTPAEAELVATAKAVLAWHGSHRFCARCGVQSQAVEAGWQRLCPACGTSHFPRTDPVVIMLVTKGDRLLLGRSPGWPDGMYSTLAGFMEPGETIEAAVRREVAEETGIVVGAVRYISSQPWPFPSSLMLGCHGAALTEAITLDLEELEDALWLTRSDMVAVLAGLHPTIKPMRKGSIAQSLVVNWLAER
jgi:NAD+ diphosphatase